ncbi:MAG: hypothetical protein ACUVQ0_03050 [Thermoproteota archaeon]
MAVCLGLAVPGEGIKAREAGRKVPSIRVGWFKTFIYIVLLAVSLSIVDMVFRWSSVEEIPLYL